MLKDNKKNIPAPTSRSNAANISPAAKAYPAVRSHGTSTTIVQRSSKDKDWENNLKDDTTTTTTIPKKKKKRKKKKTTTSSEVTTETIPGSKPVSNPGAKLEVMPKVSLEGELQLILDDCTRFHTETKKQQKLLDNLLLELPPVVYMVSNSGAIYQLTQRRQMLGLKELKNLATLKNKLNSLEESLNSNIQLIPTCIAAYSKEKELESSLLTVLTFIETGKTDLGTQTQSIEILEKDKDTARKTYLNRKTPGNLNLYTSFNEPIRVAKESLTILKEELTAKDKLQTALKQQIKVAQGNQNVGIKIVKESDKLKELCSIILTCEDIFRESDLFIKSLPARNKALKGQHENQITLDRIIDEMVMAIAEYTFFQGKEQDNDFQDYEKQKDRLLVLKEKILNFTFDEMVTHSDQCNKQVEDANTFLTSRKKLLPERPELKAFIANKLQDIGKKIGYLKTLLNEIAPVHPKKRKPIESKIVAHLTSLDEIKKDLKKINTTHEPIITIPLIKTQLDLYDSIDEDLESIPDLKDIITASRIKDLKGENGAYGTLVEFLIGSPRLLDPFNLQTELKFPVEKTKYTSRIMELKFLQDALIANPNACIQVGRMNKQALVKALLNVGFNDQAAAVEDSTVPFIETDGIIWYSDHVVAVQHKSTYALDPLSGRTHSTNEITEAEFEKQLTDASNQLSGLTSQGNTWDSFHNKLPETPPEAINVDRVANLKFFKADMPSDENLKIYEDIIHEVMSKSQVTSRKERSHYVETIILNFRNETLVYKRHENHRYVRVD